MDISYWVYTERLRYGKIIKYYLEIKMWTVERVDNTYRICYNGICKALSEDMKYAYDLVNDLNRGK